MTAACRDVEAATLPMTGLPRLPEPPFRRAVPTTPADRAGARVDCFPAHTAFPKCKRVGIFTLPAESGRPRLRRGGRAKARRLVDWLAKLSRRKIVRSRQRAALVGFQGNLLGQHDVARDEMIFRHEAPALSRQAGIV
jgi:hypothetical protein